MKPELNRQDAVVTTTVYDEQPLCTPLLDALVEDLQLKQDFPLLHAVCERQEQCQSLHEWGVEMQRKRQYAPWHCRSCGREGRMVCRPSNSPGGSYDD